MKYLLVSYHQVAAASCTSRQSVMKSNYVSNRRRLDYSDEMLRVRLNSTSMRHSAFWSGVSRLRVAGTLCG